MKNDSIIATYLIETPGAVEQVAEALAANSPLALPLRFREKRIACASDSGRGSSRCRPRARQRRSSVEPGHGRTGLRGCSVNHTEEILDDAVLRGSQRGPDFHQSCENGDRNRSGELD